MTTSGTYTITVTAADIINNVLYELGVLGAGQNAKSTDSKFVMDRLNLILLQANAQHNEMAWTREIGTLTLVTTKAVFDLKPSGGDLNIQIPAYISKIAYQYSDDTHDDLTSMTYEEYALIDDKTAPGTPQRYYYEKRLDTGKLYLDYVPDTADELIIYYNQPLEIITATTNELDIDPVWYLSLIKSTSKSCAPAYGIGYSNPLYQAIASDAIESSLAARKQTQDNNPICIKPGR